jgi:subtilase family serine protease
VRNFPSSRKLFLSLPGLITLMSMIFGTFYLHVDSAKAASLGIRSHAIRVHPKLWDSGKPDATATFPCQNPTYIVHCYGPKQIHTAYSIQPLLDRGINGSGRTIVIIDAFQSPTLVQDLHTFDQAFQLPDPKLNIIAPFGLTPFNPIDPNQVSWAEEISLDVQWAHAVAPNATIDLVLAVSNQDVDLYNVIKYAIDNKLGDTISQSFGENESCADPKLVAAQHQLYQEAAQKGISVFASSGDNGAAQPTCDGSSWMQAVSFPADDPYVTGVGGTQLFANQKSGQYFSEITWNEPQFQAASGGGFSAIYAKPSYQKDAFLDHNRRGVPDIAYNAAVSGGVLVAVGFIAPGTEGGPFHIFGGTSAGSPQWAGIAALADQEAGHRLGFLNPAIYQTAERSSYQRAFHDIRFGNNTIQLADAKGNLAVVQGYSAHTGWDPITGWGTPIVSRLVPMLLDIDK